MTHYTVSLDHIRIFAFHGLYPEEQLSGGEFEVNLQVSYPATEDVIRIDQTIDYTRLLELVKSVMQQPTPLLETVCREIGLAIKVSYPQVAEINISISKLNPPVANFQGQLTVKWHKKFES